MNLPSILMVSSEASPWAKSGGLADVVGALPEALAALGHSVAVVIPRYMGAGQAPAKQVIERLPIALGTNFYDVAIWELKSGPVTTFFVDQPGLYDRPGIYGDERGEFPDNHIRFAVLSKAALEISRRLFRTDVFHCHDWQASLLPVYLKDQRLVDPNFLACRTLLTIHNLGYQGLFDRNVMPGLGLPASLYHSEALEFWGKINFLKAGVVFADALNTVSPKYAEEIQTREYGWGLDGLLAKRRADLTGILNGVDYTQWSPENDRYIPACYSAQTLNGKDVCKRKLLKEMGLPITAMNYPLIGIVSRFASQKGFELLGDCAEDLFADGNLYLAALGSGESRLEELFRGIQSRFPRQVAVRFGYDDALAHRIEGGADMFLMPSRYEPCGLNQIYSLRYGTVPIVHATGGLDDTIVDSPPTAATGFKFHAFNGSALSDKISEASGLWTRRKTWTAIMVRGMLKDFSWTASAGEYSRLYSAIASRGGPGDSNKNED